MLEKDIEAKFRDFCHLWNLKCYKFTSPGRRGVPDRLIMGFKGRSMFLELKRPGEKPEPLQLREIRQLNERGIRAEWCDNYETAVEIVSGYFAEDMG